MRLQRRSCCPYPPLYPPHGREFTLANKQALCTGTRSRETAASRTQARVARHRTAKTRASHALVSKVSRSGTTPHGKNESIARAGIKRKHEWHDTARQKQEHRTRQKGRSSREFTLVLSGMIIQHTPPPDTAVELCMPCQALSTSARRNARGARDAGIGLAAFDR